MKYGFHTKFADERYIGADSPDKGYVAFMLKFSLTKDYEYPK